MNPPGKSNFLSLLLVLFSWVRVEGECPNTPSIPKYLASNTPYRALANYNVSEIQYDGCQPTKLWALVRHGTRNPSVEVIEQMGTRLPEIRDQILVNYRLKKNTIRNSDANAFRSWTNTVNVDDKKKLADEGKEEILLLADRLQTRFPDVLDSIYSKSLYRFKYTDTKRTKKSAKYFTTGLFGAEAADNVDFPNPSKEDPILRFYKLCTKWLTEIDGNPDALIEKTTFEKGAFVLATVKEVNERLGFSDELDYSDLYTMYLACAFETAWHQKRSPWCSVFSADNLKVMEYAEDLESYWVDGYGYELNYKQACPAFKDMMDFFQDENSPRKVTVYFTHSGTLSKMLAHFGLYKDDEPLTAANFPEHQKDRKWRVSKIDSFATNLVFVLFDCGGQQKILTLHQEEVVRLPSCPQDDLCGIEQVLQYYKSSIPCLFEEMCETS